MLWSTPWECERCQCPPYLSHSLHPSLGCHLKIVQNVQIRDQICALNSQHQHLLCQIRSSSPLLTTPGFDPAEGAFISSSTSSSSHHLSLVSLTLSSSSLSMASSSLSQLHESMANTENLSRLNLAMMELISGIEGDVSVYFFFVVASVLIGGGVTSNDGLEDETSVKGAITGGS
ncbi:hypothetical protein Tco_0783527 [Tanacetum coccineum]